MSPSWALARTILAGEQAVKRKGEQLLPRNENATDEQYERYLARSHFFNATGRTADGYVGLLFRRAPRIRALDGRLGTDFDLSGNAVLFYARQVVTEVVSVGRCGTLVDWSNRERRAYATLYRAEDIINWRVETVNGRNQLTMVVLREPQAAASPADPFGHVTVEQYRVVTLEEGKVVVRTYRPAGDRWVRTAEFHPTRRRDRLTRIPFLFHSPGPEAQDMPKLPLEDMIWANLDHYRLGAEHRNALHYVAMPILSLSGFDSTKYGPGTAEQAVGVPPTIVGETSDATAKYVEYNGQGLGAFELALDRSERFMAMLGSRLLEPRKNVGETAEAIELRQSGESSVLGALALSVGESLSQVMDLMQWWGRDPRAGEERPRISLNTDFNTQWLTPQHLREIVAAWQSGALTRDQMLEAFRRGEVLPPNTVPLAGELES